MEVVVTFHWPWTSANTWATGLNCKVVTLVSETLKSFKTPTYELWSVVLFLFSTESVTRRIGYEQRLLRNNASATKFSPKRCSVVATLCLLSDSSLKSRFPRHLWDDASLKYIGMAFLPFFFKCLHLFFRTLQIFCSWLHFNGAARCFSCGKGKEALDDLGELMCFLCGAP